MQMSQSRQVHLMKLFHPDHGDLGLYFRALMDHALKPEALKNIAKMPLEPWNYGQEFTRSTNGSEMKPMDSSHAGKYVVNAASWEPYPPLKTNNQKLIKDTGEYLDNVAQTLFSSSDFKILPHEKFQEKYAKISNLFRNVIKESYQSGHTYIASPAILVKEAIVTMRAAMDWATSNCYDDPDQSIEQMRAMLCPTVRQPHKRQMISPLEMLGKGNNTVIGQYLRQQPMLINGKPIIRNVTPEDPSVIHPEFIEMWYDVPLDIGGCPALNHRNLIGDTYMDFAKMFIEVAERIKKKTDAITIDFDNVEHALNP